MKIYAKEENYTLYEGSMLDMAEAIPDNSVGSIVCDPPYELNFMNKGWDNSGVAFDKNTWRKCYNALKPGGYLLAFGGSRTYHRIACAIEDAGFEIRDCIMWLYGSGFPKSQNVGKQVDALLDYGKSNSVALRKLEQEKGTGEKVVRQPNNGMMGEIKDVIRKDYESKNEFAGYGTCLKPAYEPIIMARKPLDGTVANNCLKYGVGALNIDECRVGSEVVSTHNAPKGTFAGGEPNRGSDTNSYKEHTGRFPANVITDGSEEVASGMPESAGSKGVPFNKNDYEENETATCFTRGNYNPYNDSGSAMRYYYAAKASKKDRDDGLSESERNIHPTVKPCELMQYLVRLVTPKGETILDPFMGSGSTGKAVMFENHERNAKYNFIGIELTHEYLDICKKRIDFANNGQLSLFDFENK